MKKNGLKTGFVLVKAAVFLCLAATPAFALFGGKIKHFTADNVSIDPNGKVVHTGKVYFSDGDMRMDDVGGMMGNEMGGKTPDLSMLALKKQGKMYFYNHDKKLVYEGPLEDEDMMPGYKSMDNIESERVLGKEKVSGYKCVKKEIITASTFMGTTEKEKLIVWESDRFDFPLRTMTDDGEIFELRNIDEGKPPKNKMQPLSGYKKVGNMMAVMGMDFGEMMAKERAMEEAEDAPSAPKSPGAWGKKTPAQPPAGSQNLEDMDVNAMMEKMNQAMGKNMTPEEKAEFMQAMTHAMNQAKQVKEGPGAAGQIWQIIPKRPGDQIGDELKTPGNLMVTMGTKAPLKSVFNFYMNKMKSKGWKDQGMYLQDGQGHLNMTKGDQRLTISSAEDPGMDGNFTQFYMLQLRGPNL